LSSKDRIKKALSNPDKTLANLKNVMKQGGAQIKRLQEGLEQFSRFTEDSK
jgi:hypothetical protein